MRRLILTLLVSALTGCGTTQVDFIMPTIVQPATVFTCPVTVTGVDADGNPTSQTVPDAQCITELKRDHCQQLAGLYVNCMNAGGTDETCKQDWMDVCLPTPAK